MSRLIGLEISSTAVRMAKVSTSGSEHRLLAFAETALPPGTVVDGAIVERQAVQNAIARCLAARGMRDRFERQLPVHLSIAGLRAITREIEMADVPDSELDDAVQLQALDIIPFPVEKTLISARRLETVDGDAGQIGSHQIRVLLAAAHRDLVEPFVEVAAEAGLNPASVDLSSSALVRALADTESTNGPEVLISIGADLTTVVVQERGRPLFVRTIAEGGNTVTRAIATALDVPFVDAENLKRYVGRAERHTPAAAIAAARDGSAKILGEIRSSIDYYNALPSSMPLRRVLLTGGGSRLSGVAERLQQLVQIPVERASCLARVHGEGIGAELTAGSPLDDVAAIAIGLALPEQPGVKHLDLIPPDFVSRRRVQRNATRVAAAAVFVLLVFIGTGVLRFLQVHNAEQGIGSSQRTIALLQSQIPKYDKIRQQDAAITTDRTIGVPLVSYEVNWPKVLDALRRFTPAGVGTSGFSGTASPPPTAATSPSGTTTTSVNLLALPTSTATLGTVNVTLTGRQYPDFQRWFDAMTGSHKVEIVSFSGVTSSGSSVSFSAQLAVLGTIQTSRFKQFDFPRTAG